MFLVPGLIISILTFPGVIVHELAHQICCRLCGVIVYQVKYFQFQNPCGYVVHENVSNPWKTLCITLGPFFINTIWGIVVVCFPAFCAFGNCEMMYQNDPIMRVFTDILFWIGISIMMHAFPSIGDANNLVKILDDEEVGIITKIISAPFIALSCIGAYGSVIWLDLAYGVAMSILISNVMNNLLFF